MNDTKITPVAVLTLWDKHSLLLSRESIGSSGKLKVKFLFLQMNIVNSEDIPVKPEITTVCGLAVENKLSLLIDF